MQSDNVKPIEFQDVQELIEDVVRLGQNPLLARFLLESEIPTQPTLSKRARKARMRAIAQDEISRRDLVRKFLPTDMANESTWLILLDIYLNRDNPDGICMKTAAITAGLSTTTSLRYFEKLEQTGLIRCITSEHDRRRKLLSLSPDGHDIVTRILLELENMLDPLMP